MAKVAFITLGCKVNQTETDAMAGLFQMRGYEVVETNDRADVYVVNTCSVTHLGDRKSRQMVRRVVRLNPQAVVAVTGCFAQVSPADAAAIDGVDVVIGTGNRDRIVDFVEQSRREKHQVLAVGNIMEEAKFEDISLQATPGRTRAFLKIQDGCDNYCSYCIIPYARGHLRSRDLDSIARETHLLAAAGFHEIVLTGINLGAYGRENNHYNLTDAVKTVLKTPGITRVRLSSTESLEISESLIDLMESNPRMCPHLHLPLQSGEDSILSSMHRPYTTADYAELLLRLRKKVPDLAVTTDIIVGFPGETTDLFNATLEYAAAMDFAKIHVFPYSRRAGTPAARFDNQVNEEEKKRRVAALLALSEQSGEKFRHKLIGRTLPILIEKVESGMAEGLTPNYQRVFFAVEKTQHHQNEVVDVEIEETIVEGLKGRLKK
jgi:threonylcarbamoyladenosine tRNA methylthiotransferase MtaB